MLINQQNAISTEPTPKGDKQREDRKLKQACYDFEALLLTRMLKEMRKTVDEDDKGSLLNSGNQFQSLFDWELARLMSKNSPIGIAKSLMSKFGIDGKDIARYNSSNFGRMNPDGEPLLGIIKSAADRFNVDSTLVRAVIIGESNGDSGAISPKGAKGLMQLMDETSQRFGVVNPFNAEQNVNAGTALLRKLLDRYDGDVEKALAAYNAGQVAVDKYEDIPPYPETQSYVRKVMALYKEQELKTPTLK